MGLALAHTYRGTILEAVAYVTSINLPINAETLSDRARRGPRYTSYPPATEFDSGFGASDGDRELASVPGGAPVSLYCHIPYCRSLCWYCGCNVKISRDRSKGSSYVAMLCRELRLLAGKLDSSTQLVELALGGGSPNFLLEEDLTRLTTTIRETFNVADDAEFGAEMDPRETSVEFLATLSQLGFTRMSVGVQDFDEAVQKAIHRFQSIEQTDKVISDARRLGLDHVNVDLVYGLPAQTPRSFSRTLDAVIGFEPQQIAMFGYAHLPQRIPHQKLVERGGHMPNALERAELMLFATDRFERAGYVQVGIDHFARPDSPLVHAALSGNLHRNFQGYVVRRAERLLGCGASAISDSGGAYWQNHINIEQWERSVRAKQLPIARGVRLDQDDQIRRYVITKLMCDAELELTEVEKRFAIDVREYFAYELDQLSRDEFNELVEIELDDGWLCATALGCQLLRNICMVFDRYNRHSDLNPNDGSRPSFSPTV